MMFWGQLILFIIGALIVPTYVLYDIKKNVEKDKVTHGVYIVHFACLTLWGILTPFIVLYMLNIIIL